MTKPETTPRQRSHQILPFLSFVKIFDAQFIHLVTNGFSRGKQERFDKKPLTLQAEKVCSELAALKSIRAAAVQTLLSESE